MTIIRNSIFLPNVSDDTVMISSTCHQFKHNIFAPRSVLITTIQTTIGKIYIVNVHLPGGKYDDKAYKGLQMRHTVNNRTVCGQLLKDGGLTLLANYREDLLKFIVRQLNVGVNDSYIIVGDTNIPYNKAQEYPSTGYFDPLYQSYFESGLSYMSQNQAQLVEHRERTSTKYNTKPDKLWFKTGTALAKWTMEAQILKNVKIGDHYLIQYTFKSTV
jgi:hypothetical protein